MTSKLAAYTSLSLVLIMMKYLLFAAALCGGVVVDAAHTGKVFVDLNRNGICDAGESGLPGVCVSDGKNVVRTGPTGNFSLPGHERERFVFVTLPSGYKASRAHYLPIRKETKDYSLGVVPYASHVSSGGAHRFVQVSDTEIGGLEEHDDWVQSLRDYVMDEPVSFIVHTGDICYEEGLKNHHRLMNTENMDVPVFYCIGNHDLVKGAYGEELFEQNYGPVYYSFDVGNVHYLVTPMPGGDYAPGYTRDEVYEWMKNDLSMVPEGMSVMVFNHDLLTQGPDFKFYNDKGDYIDLDAHHLKAWIYGHWHINHIYKYRKAYSVCTSTPVRGGIDHASAAFRVFKVDGKGDFTTELRYMYWDRKLEIASLDNLHAAHTEAGSIPLSVNTYHTASPTVKVSAFCRMGDETIVKPFALVPQTNMNWLAHLSLPDNALGKLVTVTVEAMYANGETVRRSHSFVYTPSSLPEISVAGKVWNNLSGNAGHTGISSDTLSPRLKLRWTTNVGANIYMVSPVLADNRVFVATVDEDGEGKAAVVALDARTGRMLWKSATDGSVRNSIALSGDKVFAQDVYGNLYAFFQADGRLAWKLDLETPAVPALNDGLVAEGDTVYAGTGRSLCAVHADSGQRLWRNEDWASREGCTATLAVGRDFVIGHSHWGALYANDKATGRLLWSESREGLRNRSAAPAVIGGLLYLASGESFFVIEGRTGRILVRKPLDENVDVASTPAVTDTEIIFGTATHGVVALDRETYARKWNFRTGPALIYSSPYTRNPSCTVETSPVVSGATVYVAASDGVIYALDRQTGRLQWKHATGAPCMGSVAVAGNALFAVDYAGNVYGFVQELK